MQGADVREDSGVRESDAETRHAKGQLWQPAPFLKRLIDEPRMICQCALSLGSGFQTRSRHAVKRDG